MKLLTPEYKKQSFKRTKKTKSYSGNWTEKGFQEGWVQDRGI